MFKVWKEIDSLIIDIKHVNVTLKIVKVWKEIDNLIIYIKHVNVINQFVEELFLLFSFVSVYFFNYLSLNNRETMSYRIV